VGPCIAPKPGFSWDRHFRGTRQLSNVNHIVVVLFVVLFGLHVPKIIGFYGYIPLLPLHLVNIVHKIL